MRTDSSQFEQFTVGIEEEFQIVDPNTRKLRSHVSEILEEGRMPLGEPNRRRQRPPTRRAYVARPSTRRYDRRPQYHFSKPVVPRQGHRH